MVPPACSLVWPGRRGEASLYLPPSKDPVQEALPPAKLPLLAAATPIRTSPSSLHASAMRCFAWFGEKKGERVIHTSPTFHHALAKRSLAVCGEDHKGGRVRGCWVVQEIREQHPGEDATESGATQTSPRRAARRLICRHMSLQQCTTSTTGSIPAQTASL